MGLFGGNKEEPIYKTNYMMSVIKVYPNRVDFTAGAGKKSIPVSQIASVHTAMIGKMQITIETTGGQKYKIPCMKKTEVQDAIYKAQSMSGQSAASAPAPQAADSTDELTKLAELKDKGILTEEEFAAKKKQILGL